MKPTKLFMTWPAVLGIGVVVSGLLVGCGTKNGAQTGTATMETGSQTVGAASEHADGTSKEVKGHTPSTKLTFSAEPTSLPVGKPATWTLKITDNASGQPVKTFDEVHDKLMHLIVVKNDLSWFNHIHPAHKGNGSFVVTTTLPKAGTYKLYADYTPTGKAQEVPQHEFATGAEQPSTPSVLLVPDKMQGAWLSKKVMSHTEGQPEGQPGGTYEVAMMPMPTPLVAGQESMLHFQVRDANGKPIKDLQPYLGALGHCVILSSDTKSYLHSHPVEEGMEGGTKDKMGAMGEMKNMKHSVPPKSGGPDVMFHTSFPSAGLYKTWGQFMHKGKVITAAFVVKVGVAKPSPTKTSAVSDGHDHDETMAHAH